MFSLGTPVSSTNKTDHHCITEILLKVAINTINQTKSSFFYFFSAQDSNLWVQALSYFVRKEENCKLQLMDVLARILKLQLMDVLARILKLQLMDVLARILKLPLMDVLARILKLQLMDVLARILVFKM